VWRTSPRTSGRVQVIARVTGGHRGSPRLTGALAGTEGDPGRRGGGGPQGGQADRAQSPGEGLAALLGGGRLVLQGQAGGLGVGRGRRPGGPAAAGEGQGGLGRAAGPGTAGHGLEEEEEENEEEEEEQGLH